MYYYYTIICVIVKLNIFIDIAIVTFQSMFQYIMFFKFSSDQNKVSNLLLSTPDKLPVTKNEIGYNILDLTFILDHLDQNYYLYCKFSYIYLYT